jgi:calcium-binding protein CML
MFDIDPSLRPKVNPAISRPAKHIIQLTKQQIAQIEDIFNLFDTDGGGSIDRRELNFALVALGFKDRGRASGKMKKSKNDSMVESIAADGLVSLEEFTSLMKGELSGKDPWEDLRAVFELLSKNDGNHDHSEVITFDKLLAVSQAFNVGLSREEIHSMIADVDHDGGGAVDFNEFERILRSSAWY